MRYRAWDCDLCGCPMSYGDRDVRYRFKVYRKKFEDTFYHKLDICGTCMEKFGKWFEKELEEEEDNGEGTSDFNRST